MNLSFLRRRTFDILIPSVASRTGQLTTLLEHLRAQMQPGVNVLVCRDNCETPLTLKQKRLIEASAGEYVVFVADDDWLADQYVARVMDAIASGPDSVAYRCCFSKDGVVTEPAELMGWQIPNQICPIRREHSIRWSFTPMDLNDDFRWSNEMRRIGAADDQRFIDEVMYYYRWSSQSSIQYGNVPAVDDPPPQPEFDYVRWVTP